MTDRNRSTRIRECNREKKKWKTDERDDNRAGDFLRRRRYEGTLAEQFFKKYFTLL